MARGAVDAPAGRAGIGITPGRSRGAGADEIAGPGRILTGRMELEVGPAAVALSVVEVDKVAGMTPVAREDAGADARLAHHPDDERTRPRLAAGAVPAGMAAAS